MRLTPKVHDRDVAGMTYVYPVVSRRARGVSLGINLNTNNACNWRCAYCQVPGLTRGKAPEVDLELLEQELTAMLGALLEGDYMERHVAEDSRRLNDIAFSGNGEPTSSAALGPAIEIVQRVTRGFSQARDLKTVLITNGSLTHKPDVQAALELLARGPAEAWFKLDSATAEGQRRINDDGTGVERTRRNLAHCAKRIPTWVQTMVLAWEGTAPSIEACDRYLELLQTSLTEGVRLEGVLLYGLARRSYQEEANRISPLAASWMEAFAERIRGTGLEVRLSL